MKIDEIYRGAATDFTGGHDWLASYEIYGKSKNKKYLPDSDRYYYNVDDEPYELVVNLFDAKNNNKLIGRVITDKINDFPLPNAVRIGAISTDPNYRGRGLGLALYGILLSILKRPVLSGDTQTPAGRRSWIKLNKIPGVEVTGYISVTERDLEENPRLIDTIMKNLGGEYLGKKMIGYNNDVPLHYFAVNVVEDPKNMELRAHSSAAMARIYSTYAQRDPYQAGLLARWTGS